MFLTHRRPSAYLIAHHLFTTRVLRFAVLTAAVACAVAALTGLALSAGESGNVRGAQASAVRGVSPVTMTLLVGTITVNSPSDAAANDGVCTLREAITSANTDTVSGAAVGECAAGSGTDTINFDATVFAAPGPYTINLTGVLPDLNSNININGPGASVLTVKRNSGGDYRIFFVQGGNTVSISGLKITDGVARGTNGPSGGLGFGGGIANGGTLSILNCIISGNSSIGGDGSAGNGGDSFGGGINSEGNLTITNSTIINNSATGGNGSAGNTGGRGHGGGIYHSASTTVTITGCSISSNTAAGGAGASTTGGSSHGGGFYNDSGTSNITNSTVGSNSATGGNGSQNGGEGAGGGLYNNAGTMTVTGSTVSSNSARGGNGSSNAGGLAAAAGIINGDILTVTNSTVSGNNATGGNGLNSGGDGQGGGIYSYSTMTVTNSTVSSNLARGGDGTGGAAVGGDGEGGGFYTTSAVMTVRNITVTGNFVIGGAGPASGNGIGGGLNKTTGTFNIGNTIVAGNLAFLSPDVVGTFTTQGHNLIGKNDGAAASFPAGNPNVNTDRVGTGGAPIDALLGPLANNGGATQTHALLVGSPAIDAGDNALIPADIADQDGDSNTVEPVPFDQRGTGFPRVFNSTVDIGSFEVNGPLQSGVSSFVVNTTADHNDGMCSPTDCTLREAIIAANGHPGDDTITFDATVFAAPGPHTINLIGALPELASNITITGPGANVLTVRRDTGGNYFIFGVVGPQTVTISGLTASNGLARGADGSSGGQIGGGGIVNEGGTLTINSCTISGNSARGGDGSSGAGGNVFGAGVSNLGTLTITNSTISGNTARGGDGTTSGGDGLGGGVSSLGGTVTIKNSTISGNTVTGGNGFVAGDGLGGGIYHDSGTETVTNCTITLNSAVGGIGPASGNGIGGGIYRNGGTFNIGNTIVAGNLAFLSPDVVGTFTTQGHNLIGKNDGAAASFPAGNPNVNTDRVGTGGAPIDALLGPLANNGGATQTHALLVGSPAIDAGDNALAAGLATDQRGAGFPRIVDGPDAGIIATVDIGSFEDQPTLHLTLATYSAGEGDGHATITVTRSGDLSAPASINFETSDVSGLNNCDVVTGNASQRCDYTAMGGTVNFIAGQSSASFDIPIIDDVYVEGPETLTVTLSNPTGGGTLSPPFTATVTINDNDLAPGAPNPIAGADFFIRMQYLDILNREPDPPGFAGWQSFLATCPAGSTACDRVELSSRFFRSAEFFDRAYFVYRFYDTALGRKPTYDEYQKDLRKVAGFLTASELEARKAAFAEEFSQRPEFKAKYDSKTDGDPYVNAIVATAGVVPSNRTSVAIRQGALVITRGQALRELVESPEISARFFNEAFVVIGYFAYLRREPDAQYLVWLSILNTTGDYREMIRGFIESQEYRRRFGPN